MHVFAYDQEYNLIHADEAMSGRKYNCRVCGCAMYKTSKGQTNYFACKPGVEHSRTGCLHIARLHTVRKAELTVSAMFHEWLMTEPRERGGAGGDLGGNSRGGVPAGCGGETHIRELPYRSLEDLYSNGLHKIKEMNIADGKLTDLLISNQTAGCVMDTNQAIGPRALQVKIDKCFPERKVFRFVLCDYVGSRRKIFEMFFEDREAYQDWQKKMFEPYIKADGSSGTREKFKFVLIHGFWESVSQKECCAFCRKECRGRWRCTGYQRSNYVSRRQIYCPPAEKNNW